nr:MarR family transcriptional regulator [Planctomonas sp. JC2975]
MDTALRGIGVSLVQWDALRAVERMPGASGHDLASATFQSDQSFGTLASRLIERGLIDRSAGRGRRLEYTLTQHGRAVLEHGRIEATTALRELFSPLDEAQRSALLDTLTALTRGEPADPAREPSTSDRD